MKLLNLLIFVLIELSYSIKVNLSLQEQLLKSMSVFDVIESGILHLNQDKPSNPPAQTATPAIPQQVPQTGLPPLNQAGTIIPGAPGSDTSAGQSPSSDLTQSIEVYKI